MFIFAIDVKMDWSAFEEKSSFKMLQVTFSSKLDWGTYIISIAKSFSKNIGVLTHSMKFLLLEVAPYLFLKKLGFTPCKAKQLLQRKKRSTKRLEHTGNIFGKNLHLTGVC